ncbi:hypothetical protein OFO03_06795 [Campylobacter sp. JMF_02 ED1]|uniref:hypothetical protein n=1 Tax=unclassified Campylobacter TaxID=2593542 RepID=UPI0022E9BDC9|nr:MULTISPECIES: hypothetical protein [unclassified Campylobacter]MDA3050174.1 hypothetical protein [Campylobacter sp. JMF_15 NE4]MDA3051605.1 hypothetical protein [Campylobacter sp. JMF_02 ED1]
MQNFKILILAVISALCLSGCIAQKTSSNSPSSGNSKNFSKGSISSKTLQKLADDSTKNLLSKNKFPKQKNRFSIVGISEVDCEKTCDFDRDFLRKKIKVALLHSGRVVVIDAPSDDEFVFSNKGIKKDDSAHANSIYAPDFILIPKIKKEASGRNYELSLRDANKKSEIWHYKKAI